MENIPPKDYLFAFTMAELFDLTGMIEQRQRALEIQLGEAYMAHDRVKQKSLHIVLERTINMHDMLAQPINAFSDEMADMARVDEAQEAFWKSVDEAGHDPNDATDPYADIDGDDLKDYFYKN